MLYEVITKPDLLKYVFYKGDIARKIVMDESIHLKSQNIGLGLQGAGSVGPGGCTGLQRGNLSFLRFS